jgi:hypothetical protein
MKPSIVAKEYRMMSEESGHDYTIIEWTEYYYFLADYVADFDSSRFAQGG